MKLRYVESLLNSKLYHNNLSIMICLSLFYYLTNLSKHKIIFFPLYRNLMKTLKLLLSIALITLANTEAISTDQTIQ